MLQTSDKGKEVDGAFSEKSEEVSVTQTHTSLETLMCQDASHPEGAENNFLLLNGPQVLVQHAMQTLSIETRFAHSSYCMIVFEGNNSICLFCW